MLPDSARTIAGDVGILLKLLALLLLIPLAIGAVQGESRQLMASYILTILLAGALGLLLSAVGRDEIPVDVGLGMIMCAVGWVFASLVVAVPFAVGLGMNFLDAFFESVSGFTTTGITLLQGLEQLPISLMFLRSFIQWLGGLGILSFFLLVVFRGKGVAWRLFEAESHKVPTSRPTPNLFRTIQILWAIYLGMTLFQVVLLAACGVGLFDAVLHSMSTVSTGGFSRFDASIGHLAQAGHPNYRLIEYIVCLFMFLGGTSFLMHYKLVQKDWADVLANVEFRAYVRLVLGMTVLITFSVLVVRGWPARFAELEETVRTSLFQVLAVMTTTGFATQPIGSVYFGAFARQLFLVMMLIGGSVGSTSGGFKVFRIVVLSRLFGRQIRSLALPRRAVTPLAIEGRQVDWEDVYHIGGLLFAWLLLILIGGLITALFSPHGMAESLSGMFSAVNNIGPCYLTVEEMIQLHPVVKLTYIIGMLAGRLEIIPIIALFRSDVWRR